MSSTAESPDPSPFEEILHQRLRWMVRVRWLAMAGIFFTILLADRIANVTYVKTPLYVIVAFIFIYNIVLDLRLNRFGRAHNERAMLFEANLQIGLDFIALLGLVMFTGGVQNLFVFYVIFHIAIGSILLPRRNMIIITVAICAACIGLFWIDYLDLFPHQYRLQGFLPETVHTNRTYVFGLSYIFLTLVAVTAYMSSTIGKNLRDAQQRLMTVSKELEQRRIITERQNREIIDLARSKNEFIALAAHQFKTPLDEIEDIAEDLFSDGCLTEADQRLADLARVRDNVAFLHEVVDDMQTMARLRDHQSEMKKEKIDLASIARKSIASFASLAEIRNIKIKAEVPAELPPIEGDRQAWKKVFDNLIENSINYSEHDTTIEFRLERDWQGEWIKGEIRDQGMGISPEHLSRIYDEFYRSHEAESAAPGTGMGLSIVKRVIEMHSGTLEVESKSGRGSTFRISVPVAQK